MGGVCWQDMEGAEGDIVSRKLACLCYVFGTDSFLDGRVVGFLSTEYVESVVVVFDIVHEALPSESWGLCDSQFPIAKTGDL